MIKLTEEDTGQAIYINPQYIVCISVDNEETRIRLNGVEYPLYVTETPEEIMELIK